MKRKHTLITLFLHRAKSNTQILNTGWITCTLLFCKLTNIRREREREITTLYKYSRQIGDFPLRGKRETVANILFSPSKQKRRSQNKPTTIIDTLNSSRVTISQTTATTTTGPSHRIVVARFSVSSYFYLIKVCFFLRESEG